MKKTVPELPKKQIIIAQEDEKRLTGWIEFFKNLSPRMNVIRPRENEFEGFLERAESVLRRNKLIESDYIITDWPKEEEIAFVAMINSAETGAIVTKQKMDDCYIFLFGDVSFSLNHFHWDGDGEKHDWRKEWSYSSHYSNDLLTWDFIATLIVGKVKYYESRVPTPPK